MAKKKNATVSSSNGLVLDGAAIDLSSLSLGENAFAERYLDAKLDALLRRFDAPGGEEVIVMLTIVNARLRFGTDACTRAECQEVLPDVERAVGSDYAEAVIQRVKE